MKKLIKWLKGLTILTGFCGLLSVACLVNHETRHKVESVSALSTTVPDLDKYTPYDVYDSSFYFDWTYLTYDVPSNNNNENNSLRLNYREHEDTITDLTGLYYRWDYIFSLNTGGSFVVDFYSYIYRTHDNGLTYRPYFELCTSIVYNGDIIQYRCASDNVLYTVFDGSQDYPYVWTTQYSRNLIFVGSGGTNQNFSSWINGFNQRGDFYDFYEFDYYINQVSTLQSEIDSLENDISSLENQNNSLSSQVSTLQNQVNSLTTQLNNAISVARQNTYIVDVKSILHYEFQIYVNVDYQSDQDFYIKPNKIVCRSSIEVTDASGSGEESHFNVIDTLDFTSLSTYYYYNYSDLYNYLYVNVNDNWNLEIPYYDDGEVAHFSLTNINTYIDNWILDYNTDLSVSTSYEYFRSAMVEYNNLISGAMSGTNMAFLDGYSNGYDEGYVYGKQQGYLLGQNDGYTEGVTTNSTVFSIFNGILQVAMLPVNFFLAIFNFEILGINLSGFIRAIFTIAIVVIIIRTVFGGKGASDS